MKFEIVNVFTMSGSNSGNQLAIVYPDLPLETSQMQSIARDFNFSETVFIYDNYDL